MNTAVDVRDDEDLTLDQAVGGDGDEVNTPRFSGWRWLVTAITICAAFIFGVGSLGVLNHLRIVEFNEVRAAEQQQFQALVTSSLRIGEKLSSLERRSQAFAERVERLTMEPKPSQAAPTQPWDDGSFDVQRHELTAFNQILPRSEYTVRTMIYGETPPIFHLASRTAIPSEGRASAGHTALSSDLGIGLTYRLGDSLDAKYSVVWAYVGGDACSDIAGCQFDASWKPAHLRLTQANDYVTLYFDFLPIADDAPAPSDDSMSNNSTSNDAQE